MKKFLIFLVAFLSLFCIRNKCFGIEFSIGDKSYSIDDEKLITKSSYNSSNIEVDKIDLNKYSNYIVMPQDSSGELSEIRVLFFPTSVVPTISVTLSGSGTIHVGNLYFSPYSTEYYQVSLNVDSNSNITYNSLFFGTLNSGSCNYTTGFNGTGYLYEAYIAAGRDVRVAFPYVSFDLYNYKTSELIKSADSKKDENISDNSSKLKITYTCNANFSICQVYATLEGGLYSDKIYYSTVDFRESQEGHGGGGVSFDGTLVTTEGIEITNNCTLFFKAVNVDGEVIATNSLTINFLMYLNPSQFKVYISYNNINGSSDRSVQVCPVLVGKLSEYYDIYYKLDSVNFLFSPTKNITNVFETVNSGSSMEFKAFSDEVFNIYFEVRCKYSDKRTVLRKSFKISLSSSFSNTVSGEINGESADLSSNPFASLNENSSIDDLISASKNTFTLFQSAFSILPGWIWALISIFLTVCIVLRILGR